MCVCVCVVATTLRACLLVDCTSSLVPQYIGMHTSVESTTVDFKKVAAQALGMIFNEKRSVRSFFMHQCIVPYEHSLVS